MEDPQRMPTDVEEDYMDDLWSRIEDLDQTKLFEEAKRINSIKRQLNQQGEKNLSLEKKLKQLKSDSEEINKLLNLLKANNDRFVETWDLDDPLLGAYSANEFMNFDFIEVLDHEFHDSSVHEEINDMAEEVLTIEKWIKSLPSDPEKLKNAPPNRKGQLLKRLKSLETIGPNVFRLRREELLDQIELNFEEVFYDNEAIKRYSRRNDIIKNHMTYFFDYIRYRIDRKLPWAICGQYIGFVACPPSYRTLIFNPQDGYFNAGYLSEVFDDKTIEDFFRTVEGKLLIKNFPERYFHNGKGIPGAYRFSDSMAKMFADSFVWSGLPGITFETFRGIYIHPEILESFASYLGQQTLDWVMPNLRYLRLNPARYINGDSWFINVAGSVPPSVPTRIKPLQKHLILWMRESEDPFHVHVSFGDKWYLKKVLRESEVLLVSEFFGILDQDYPKVEKILSENGQLKRFKTWYFSEWNLVKKTVTDIYLQVDRAYYGYDELKDYTVSLSRDVLYTREREYTMQDQCKLLPDIIACESSQLMNDDLYGDISNYIVNEDDELEFEDLRKEFFDDYDQDIVYKFKSIKHHPSTEQPEVEYKEYSRHDFFVDISWRDSAKGEAIDPEEYEIRDAIHRETDKLSATKLGLSSSRISSNLKASSRGAFSSNKAQASEYDDPLLLRERRKQLLRAAIVTFLIKEYTETHNRLKAGYNDPKISSALRVKRYNEYLEKYHDKDHEKIFLKKIVKAFYNIESVDLEKELERYRARSAQDTFIDVIELDNQLADMLS